MSETKFDIITYFLRVYLVLYCCLELRSPCSASIVPGRDAPVVSTTLGRVRGITNYSRLHRHYYQYLGIPYAEPPVAELRFEAPVPWRKPWNDIRAADTFGSPCLQFDAILRGRIVGEENCLFLNIFTPSVDESASLPVMVWVHGGGFVAGSSDMFDPKYFMDNDMVQKLAVFSFLSPIAKPNQIATTLLTTALREHSKHFKFLVVVTSNYRLASMGFLNTGDHLIRGNMGLKDQNLALRFVRDNIRKFGGDPNRVTLMGESAGGAAVHYHVISKLSAGLFTRAIMQSGNVFNPWAYTRSPQKQAIKFGKSVGCPTENTTVLVNCLKKMDGRSIVVKHEKILSPVHTQDDFFAGSVEMTEEEDTFLSENPFIMLKNGNFNHVSVIFGMNSAEGALKTARLEATPEVLNTLDTRWNDHVAILLHYNPERKDVSEKIRYFYCPRRMPFPPGFPWLSNSTVESENKEAELTPFDTIPPQNALENVTTMISDGVWYHATKEAAIHHAKYAPVYLNYFSYHSNVLPSTYTFIKSARRRNNVPAEFTWPRYLVEAYFNQIVRQHRDHKRFGACHGDDLMYYWSTNPVVQIRTFSQDYVFSRDFVTSLSDFIRETPELKFGNVTWEPVNNETEKYRLRYMKLDRDSGMIEQPFEDRIAFIDSLNIRDPLDPNNW